MDFATLGVKIDSTDARRARAELSQFADAAVRTEKEVHRSTSRMSSDFSGLAGVLGTVTRLFAGVVTTAAIRDVAMMTARYDTLGLVVGVAGNNAGYTRREMAGLQYELQKTGVAAMESRQVLATLASAQMDLAQTSKLARVAQDAAVAGNINSSEALERMVFGIQAANSLALRGIGINVSFEGSYAKLAAQIGKTAAQLTERDKLQARTNAVLAEGIKLQGLYEESMTSAGKQINSMKRYVDNLKISLGEVFQPALLMFAEDFTALLKSSNDYLIRNRESIQSIANAIRDDFRAGIMAVKGIYDMLPAWMVGAAGIGLVGGILFGPKGFAMVAGASIMADWAKEMGKLAGLASAGEIAWGDLIRANREGRKKLLDDWEKAEEGDIAAIERRLQKATNDLAAERQFGGENIAKLEGQVRRYQTLYQEAIQKRDFVGPLMPAGHAVEQARLAAKRAADEEEARFARLAEIRRKAEEINKKYIESLKLEAATLNMSKDVAMLYRAALDGATPEQIRLMAALQERIAVHESEGKILAASAKAIEELNDAMLTDDQKQIVSIQRKYEKLGAVARQMAILGEITEETADSMQVTFGWRMQEEIDKLKDKSKEVPQIFKDIATDIHRSMVDMFEKIFTDGFDNFKNLADSIFGMFRRMLSQMAAMAVARPIVVPMVTSVGAAMGVSPDAQATTLGQMGIGDGASLASLGGTSFSSLFSPGTLVGLGTGGLAGISSFAYNLGLDAVGNLAFDAANWMSGLADGLAGGLTAGVGSLAISLLSGQGLNAKTLGGAALAGLGGALLGPLGAIAGGLVGSLFGSSKPYNTPTGSGGFTLTEQVPFVQDQFDPLKGGFSPVIRDLSQWKGSETGQWYIPIVEAYEEVVSTIQLGFNEQIATLVKTLPEAFQKQFLDAVSGQDYQRMLAEASAGNWAYAQTEEALQGIAEKYAKAISGGAASAYLEAFAGWLEQEGAAGIFGGSSVWAKLTGAAQANVENMIQQSMGIIRGGDLDKGVSQINQIGQALAAVENALKPITEIIETADLSDYELSLRNINIQFDQYAAALQAAGVDLERYTDLEIARTITLNKLREEEDKRLAEDAARLLDQRYRLEIELLKLTGDEAGALAWERRLELEAMDSSLWPLKERIWALQDEAKVAAEAAKAAEEFSRTLESAFKTAESGLKDSFGAEKDRIRATYESLVENQRQTEDLLRRSYAAQRDMMEANHQVSMELLRKQAGIARDNVSLLSRAASTLRQAIDRMFVMTPENAAGTIQGAIAGLRGIGQSVRGGNISALEGMDQHLAILAQDNSDYYGSFEEYQRDFLKAKIAIFELEGLTDNQLTVQGRTLAALEARIDQSGVQHQENLNSLQSQFDAILRVDNSVISMDEAISEFEAAWKAAEEFRLDAQLSALDNQLNALLGIDNSVLSLAEAITNFLFAKEQFGANQINQTYQSMVSRNAQQDEADYWMGRLMTGSSIAEVIDGIIKGWQGIWLEQGIPGFAVGTNSVPEPMIARFNGGEEITPAPYVDLQRAEREQTNRLLERMNGEIISLRKELADANAKLTRNTKNTADLFEMVTEGGDAMRIKNNTGEKLEVEVAA